MTDQPIHLDVQEMASHGGPSHPDSAVPVFTIDNAQYFYNTHAAVRDVSLTIDKAEITAFIGPSGCGKSTILRSLNRMNDFIDGARVEGLVAYHGINLYGADVDPIEVRRRIGMVFQTPNVFPKSVFDNVAYGPRVNHRRANLDAVVEESLIKAALWDEVKDDLRRNAMSLSLGQQQRLVIARCLAVQPEVILMDEPCASLDPIATSRIESLMRELASEYTIVIVTHNMQQAARVSDRTAFFTTEFDDDGVRHGRLVEYGPTRQIFTSPQDHRTEDYISGRFG